MCILSFDQWLLTSIQSYEWRHPDTPATLVRSSVHASNLLLSHLYLCGEVPAELKYIKEMVIRQPVEKPNSRYQWMDEGSMDHALCALAFKPSEGSDLRLAKAEDFGC